VSNDPIRRFLGLAANTVPDEDGPARKAVRIDWITETMKELKAAQDKADEAWMQLVRDLPDEDDDDEEEDEEAEEIAPPPEQAELDAIHAKIKAVMEHDRWPRELYWGAV
jgi:hypothetical protein